jgi:hypothetical protein
LRNIAVAEARLAEATKDPPVLEQTLKVAKRIGDLDYQAHALARVAVTTGGLGDEKKAFAILDKVVHAAKKKWGTDLPGD